MDSNYNLSENDIEQYRKDHPDWFVNGKLYIDEKEREQAKAEYEKQKAEAEKQKAEEDAKKKDDLKRYDTARGTIVGNDASVELSQNDLKELVGGIDLNAVLGNPEEIRKRQHILNPDNYASEIKTPNPGKPPNNEDAFPVDLKIEELEVHKPDIKIYQVTCPTECQELGKAILKIGDTAEKRIVKLENMMATLTRYLFRLGSRVSINCVYYGGNTPFEKYKGIRCLCDNRIQDGQEMQIDQCLTCTRYEPLYGQVYECLNDLGSNVAGILDDNQMAYNSMDNYINGTRVEKQHDEPSKAKIDLSTVTTKIETDHNDWEFKRLWGNGIQMKWDLVPKEQQKPHINWRQSINDDGSHLKRLASFPQNEANAGANIVSNSKYSNVFIKNKEAMDTCTNKELAEWIKKGQQTGNNVSDNLINQLKGGLTKEIRASIGSQQGLDPLAIACCNFVNGDNINTVISKLVNIKGSTGVDNPALNISAYMAGINAIIGYGNIPRIDKVTKPKDEHNDKKSSSSTTEETFHLNWDNRDTWYWTEFAEPLSINAKANKTYSDDTMSFFPKVCYLYCALLPYCKTSEYDGDWAAFPFTDEEIQSHQVCFTSKYGPRDDRIHHGIDLGTDTGTPIHAIADGTVLSDTGSYWSDWHCIIIDHGNGIYSKYMHCDTRSVNGGDTVSKGDIIGTVGTFGHGENGAYPEHLHLEIGPESLTGSSQNPIDYYPLLADHQPDRGSHQYNLATHTMS